MNQRGDTLVEVAIAMAILGSVITSAYFISNRAQIVGRDARERLQAAQLQQRQAEAIRSLRDDLGWSAFRTQLTAAAPLYVLAAAPSTDPCEDPSVQKFNVVPTGVAPSTRWGLQNGKNTLDQYTQCVTVHGTAPYEELNFTVYVSWQSNASGGTADGRNRTIMTTTLTDVHAP